MTIPRTEQIDLNVTPFYHCVSRCVRGSYLCGKSLETGKDYSYRKQWIAHLIKDLSQGFAIQIAAYSVMSNHYHVVLHVDSDVAKRWTNDDIKRQYAKVFPASVKRLEQDINDGMLNSIADDIIHEWHERLTDISWFMRCLNERIARWANKDDNVKGRFWEGRFKSQALLDQGAILSAMAYVDLNPIRAKLAKTPEKSKHTSVKERIELMTKLRYQSVTPYGLMPFYSKKNTVHTGQSFIEFELKDYLELVDATGKVIRQDKRGAIPSNLPSILNRVDVDLDDWFDMVENLETSFNYGVGSDAMMKYCGFKRKQQRSHDPFEQQRPSRLVA